MNLWTSRRSCGGGLRAAATAIVKGSIRPNEQLIERELAERLHVSRTPVREVMLRLVGDGLIVSHRRGWVVREHSAEEIQ